MAARNLAPLRALDRDVTLIFGGGTGAGNANLTSIRGPGITSITKTGGAGSGTYTVTLTDKWSSILYVAPQVIDAGTADDWLVNVLAISASAKTISIAVYKGGAAADLTTSQQLRLMVAVGNTAQPAGATRP